VPPIGDANNPGVRHGLKDQWQSVDPSMVRSASGGPNAGQINELVPEHLRKWTEGLRKSLPFLVLAGGRAHPHV